MKTRKFLVALTAIAGASQLFAQDARVGSYFESVADFLPLKLNDTTIRQEFRFYDNYSEGRKGQEHSNYRSLTSIGNKLTNTKDNLTYGLELRGSYECYREQVDDDENGFGLDVEPILIYNVGGQEDKLFFNVRSRYIHDSLSNADGHKAKRFDNNVKLSYDIASHDRLGLVTTLNFNNKTYTESEYKSRSRNIYTFGLAPYYKCTEKLKVGLEGNYDVTRYRNDKFNSDNEQFTIDGFADYRIFSKLSVHLNAGYSFTDYEGYAADTTGDREWMFEYGAALKYTANERLAFTLSSSSAAADSDSSYGMVKSWGNTFRAEWKATDKLSLIQSLSAIHDNEYNNRSDIDKYIYLAEIRYKFSDKLDFTVGYSYENGDFKYTKSDYIANECFCAASWRF